jgi:hypothetical protein
LPVGLGGFLGLRKRENAFVSGDQTAQRHGRLTRAQGDMDVLQKAPLFTAVQPPYAPNPLQTFSNLGWVKGGAAYSRTPPNAG